MDGEPAARPPSLASGPGEVATAPPATAMRDLHDLLAAPPLRRAVVPMMAAPHGGTLIERLDLTQSVARFRVRLDEALTAIEPGQYLTLGLTIDSRPIARPYSVADARDGARELEFLIRHVAAGALTPALWRLRPGARLQVGRPRGRFRLTAGDARAHLLVATGTGLAPVLAMARSLIARGAATRGPAARAVVVHGVSYAAELAYRDLLGRWAAASPALAYEPVVSRPGARDNAGWTGRTGRIDDALDGVWRDAGLVVDGTVAYVCGNPEMVAVVARRLASLGLPEDAIHTEGFWATRTA